VEPSPNVRLEGLADVFVGQGEIEPFRIEVASAPFFGSRMLGICRVGHDRQKILISRNAADILWRAGSGTIDAGGHTRRGIQGQSIFEFDDMGSSQNLPKIVR